MTTRQRAKLRSMGTILEPIVHIGKEGINDNLCKQAWDALEARELIKVTVQKNALVSLMSRQKRRMALLSCGAKSIISFSTFERSLHRFSSTSPQR